VQESNVELYRKQNVGEVVLLEEEKTAEAQKMNAEAALFARQQAVAGELFAKQTEAEGLMAVAHAQGVYVLTLLNAFAGNYVVMKDYLMINNGVYQEIAKTNAGDVAGLKPNIIVWTNGEDTFEGSGDSSISAIKEICGVYRMLPPLLKTVQEQRFTVNPCRRIRQHNGEIRCGAESTKSKRPWEMVLCIYGFPTNVSALQ
ncbi:Flotillin-like protein, partial [Thalictrum thalictroides]